MANINDPYGFRPVKEGSEIEVEVYRKATGAAINEGDLVKLTAAGEVAQFVAGDGKCLGVAAEYKAATATEIAVYDDPRNRFRVQTDSTAGFAAGDEGQNADIGAAPVAGGPDGRRSGMVLDMATKAVTATLPVKVIALAPKINDSDNDAGINSDVIVQLNNMVRGSGDGSTGI